MHLRRIVSYLPATLTALQTKPTIPPAQTNDSPRLVTGLEQNRFSKGKELLSSRGEQPGIEMKNRLESSDWSAHGPRQYLSRSMSSCIPRLSEMEVVEETFLLTDMK